MATMLEFNERALLRRVTITVKVKRSRLVRLGLLLIRLGVMVVGMQYAEEGE